MTDYCFAQTSPEPTATQCQLIRLAVAQFGSAAARRHALETYGPEAVKTGDKYFINRSARGNRLGVERSVSWTIGACGPGPIDGLQDFANAPIARNLE
jgi:hypothetical protein